MAVKGREANGGTKFVDEKLQDLVVTIYTTQPQDVRSRLRVQVVCFQDAGCSTGLQCSYTEWAETAAWKHSRWTTPRSNSPGTMLTGTISAPATLTLGVLRLEKLRDPSGLLKMFSEGVMAAANEETSQQFIVMAEVGCVLPANGSTRHATVPFPAHTWVAEGQGPRVLLPGLTLLPSETPPQLKTFRDRELAALQGLDEPGKQLAERRPGDRVYDYDVYNDASWVLPREDPDGNWLRPVLGGATRPYPRRLRTGRPVVDGYELPATAHSMTERAVTGNWLPLDERWEDTHMLAFLSTVVPTSTQHLLDSLSWRRHRRDSDQSHFKTFAEVDSLFALPGAHLQAPQTWWGALLNPAKALAANKFAMPVVRAQRPLQWHTDPEFGRQAVAGANPCIITSVTQAWIDKTGFTDACLSGSLEGASIQSLIKQGGRLFHIDYVNSIYESFQAKVASYYGEDAPRNRGKAADRDVRVLHQGRCLLFLRSSGHLVPVGIELKGPTSPMRLYTPEEPEIWRLAKAVFASLDNGYHSLVSHWLRTHAVMEPFIIALNRRLSIMHPVFKLLKPHCKGTLMMNAFGRSGLIHAAKSPSELALESVFTQGKFILEMASAVYDKAWRFDEQGLEADLIKRGMVKMKKGGLRGKPEPVRDAAGRLEPLLDYPYAQDGLDIWYHMVDFFDKYLRLYYNDDVDGKRVTDDEEVMGWYGEVKTRGHPDKQDGWPLLHDIASLRDVCVTMAWIASPHHAAVNFSMYDYTGYMPNHSAMVRRDMPQSESQVEALLQNFEEEYLKTLASPEASLMVLLSCSILNTHTPNEVYLTDPHHDWIMDSEALDLHAEFAGAMKECEATFEERNASNSLMRGSGTLPYTFMLPSSTPGRTGRGIPYSCSV